MVMEQLTEDAVAARKEGMTYGQYIAKFKPQQPPAERFPKRKGVRKVETSICEYCGCEYIPSDNRNRKYCGARCRRLRNAESANEKYYREKGQNQGGDGDGILL